MADLNGAMESGGVDPREGIVFKPDRLVLVPKPQERIVIRWAA
jgi:hypothetical protein